MPHLDFTLVDLDFPVGVKNKTAVLVAGEEEAILVDAGFTRADGHRLAATALDAGRALKTVFLSHSDPDYYWGLGPLASAFPEARLTGTPATIEHAHEAFEGKLAAWEPVGINRPEHWTEIASVAPADLVVDGVALELCGAHEDLPDRQYLWEPASRTVLGGVLLFGGQHVWTADTATPARRAAWIELLDEIAALDPRLVLPGHRVPGFEGDPVAWTRDYLVAFEEILGDAADGAAATAALQERFPQAGLDVAAQTGPKVAKGEMAWG